VVAQLVQDLVHLEGRQNVLDQDGGLDRAGLEPKRLFREVEDLVPKARFETALELRNVEPGPLGVVEDIQAEVEERAGDRLAVDVKVPLGVFCAVTAVIALARRTRSRTSQGPSTSMASAVSSSAAVAYSRARVTGLSRTMTPTSFQLSRSVKFEYSGCVNAVPDR
jgi:hypothetical protein